MRAFVAIVPPPAVAERLYGALAPARDAVPQVRWLSSAAWHCTVRFLGEIPERDVSAISEVLDAAARASAPVPVIIGGSGGVGAFPSWRRARVVWLALTPDPRLELLHHDVELGLNALGFEVEGRAFRPHVTIARLAEGPEATSVRAALRAAMRDVARAPASHAARLRAEMTVTHLHLMRSIPGPAGARYEPVHVAALGRVA